MQLKVSKDRKVANVVNKAGTQAAISNTFGLPAGDEYSCGGMTEVCGKICYANKLETLFPAVRLNVLTNWDLLKGATYDDMVAALDEVLITFERESDKRNAEKFYRVHWDGDFFSEDYTAAWIEVFRRHPSVQFWVYTREALYAVKINNATLPNVSLYLSGDQANQDLMFLTKEKHGIRIAYLANTFAEAQEVMRKRTGRPGARCPEQTGQIPLISPEGSACGQCRLCVDGKADIVFSITKK